MADVHTVEQRRRNMAQVKSKNTQPELVLRKALFSLGYRYRIHASTLPGKPDIVFPSRKKAIFVNGCFWHSHTCKYGQVVPATRYEFWATKRSATVARDSRKKAELEALGWRVLTVWECELRQVDCVLTKVLSFLDS